MSTEKVGTSNSNSHTFLRHSTTHRILENGDREYRFYIDGVCVRKAVLPKGKYALEHKKIVPIKWEDQTNAN